MCCHPVHAWRCEELCVVATLFMLGDASLLYAVSDRQRACCSFSAQGAAAVKEACTTYVLPGISVGHIGAPHDMLFVCGPIGVGCLSCKDLTFFLFEVYDVFRAMMCVWQFSVSFDSTLFFP